MKIHEVLAGVRRLYVDAAPLVYYVEENAHYVERMEAVIALIEHTSIHAVSSVLTLTEVLTLPLRLGQVEYEQAYREILQHSTGFQLLPVTAEVADEAARLRARHNLRTPDAIHTAMALQAGCDAFLTNDQGIKRVTGLNVLLLDILEVDRLTP